MKTGLIIIGAQKCGTTALFEALASHPQMNGCRLKEPDFFSKTPDWQRDLAQYEALFAHRPGTIAFEASPSYTFYPMRRLAIWDDLHSYNPDLKLIYLVRNPVDRVISAYMHMYERGSTDLPLERCLIKNSSVVQITRYYTQIRPYIEKFGRDRVLLLDFDDLTRRRQATLEQVAAFIEIDPTGYDPNVRAQANAALVKTKKHHRFDKPSLPMRAVRRFMPGTWARITDNSGRAFRTRPTLSREHRQMVLNLLELEIRALEGLMGRSFDHWFHEEA